MGVCIALFWWLHLLLWRIAVVGGGGGSDQHESCQVCRFEDLE